MKFEKGNKAAKGKGRPKGSKSIGKLLKAEQVMADLEFNPIEALVLLAQDKDTATDIKTKILIELSNFVNAKPKAKEEDPPEDPPTGLESVPTGDLLAFTKKPQ